MEKRKAAVVLDNIFLVCGVWLISYLWTRYYVMNLFIALIAASGIALCVMMLINLRRQRNKRERKKQKHIDNIMNQFLFGGKDFSIEFIFFALKTKLAEKNNSNTKQIVLIDDFILAKKTAVFTKFSPLQINTEQLIECFAKAKKADARRIIVLTLNGLDKFAIQCLTALPDIKIDIFDKNKSYDFLGWLGNFPKITYTPIKQKTSIKNLAKSALSPAKFKHYLAISIILMIGSYFAMYPIYYIIIASITFTLAILSKVRKRR